eukprot:Anaeramoba_ignava/a91115_32.p2 GENE.a91115_32~~a91115_32.p2  ORF type:complete len:102 (+),score=11.10 a91115_32:797-1102(+)
MLRAKLDEYKQRVGQLESVVDGFKLEQLEIEEGIKDVLTQLDQLEDQITAPAPASPEVANVPSEPQEVPAQKSQPLAEPGPEQFSGTQPEPAEQAPELEIF